MKILLVSNMYPSEKNPSYGVFVKNFVEGFEREGASIDKVVLHKENNKFLKILKYIFFYNKIIQKGLFNDYDLIYVHYISHCAIPLIILNKLKKFKLFINVHGSDVIPEKKSQKKFQKYVRNIITKSYRVIVPSRYFKGIVCNKFNLEEEKIIISPSSGINKDIFYDIKDKYAIRNKYNIPVNDILVGYVSRIDIGKGWDIFLRSFKELKDKGKENIKGIVVGSGSEINKFKKLINELNLQDNIIYIGLLPQKELNEIYNIIDIFCFPTIREGESLGLVALEAMTCGVPVIGNDIGALSEYIVDGVTGYLVKSKKYFEFYEKMDLLINELKYKKIYYNNNCIKMSSRYESGKVIKELYKKIK